MKISFRGLCCPRSIAYEVGVFRCCPMRESTKSSCKDNIPCNKVYIIKTLVFCIHILAVCMTAWSWSYIRWSSSFDLKTGCDRQPVGHNARGRWRPVRMMAHNFIPRCGNRWPLPYSTNQAMVSVSFETDRRVPWEKDFQILNKLWNKILARKIARKEIKI
jgi:hypothetical protein